MEESAHAQMDKPPTIKEPNVKVVQDSVLNVQLQIHVPLVRAH